jgi:hypothetical protein
MPRRGLDDRVASESRSRHPRGEVAEVQDQAEDRELIVGYDGTDAAGSDEHHASEVEHAEAILPATTVASRT